MFFSVLDINTSLLITITLLEHPVLLILVLLNLPHLPSFPGLLMGGLQIQNFSSHTFRGDLADSKKYKLNSKWSKEQSYQIIYTIITGLLYFDSLIHSKCVIISISIKVLYYLSNTRLFMTCILFVIKEWIIKNVQELV